MGMPSSEAEKLTQQAFREAQQQAEFLVVDAQQQADALLAQAHQQAQITQQHADAVLAGVEANISEQTQAGYNQGYADGQHQAQQDCATALADQLATANLLAEQAVTFKHHMQQHLSANCVELMQHLLSNLLGQAWATNKASLLTLALEQLIEQQHETTLVQLVLHPSHIKHLQGQGLTCKAPLKLLADPLLAPTDALVVVHSDEASLPETLTLFSPTQLNVTLSKCSIVTNPKAANQQEV